ncbi:MAG: RT0821/Lpp0805 family surface protein [Myxococcota bacterium]|nr:RT0821/Lpp0805 family surface protein [Myxococcota bacterium]
MARVAGASAPGIIGGALAGRMLGGSIGRSLDERDEELALKAAEQSFERAAVGEPTSWRNSDSGNSGSITATREFENDLGERCREYREVVRTGGQEEVVTGIACRGSDGRWRE